MAAKKTAKFKMPPMWPLTVAAKELATEERRSRFFADMADLADSGFVERVLRVVKAERGAFVREGHAWPEWVRNIADFEFRRASLLEALVSECRAWSGVPEGQAIRAAFEARSMEMLQRLLDEVFEEGRELHRRNTEAMAGLSGSVGDVAALKASSGLEAAGNLAWCVRRAVLAIANPFWPFVVSASSRRIMRKQSGRDEPRSPQDLQLDDLAILRSCKESFLAAKEVARSSEECGFKMSASHASKRKSDLMSWGFLRGVRRFEVTDKGRKWLRDAEVLQSVRA